MASMTCKSTAETAFITPESEMLLKESLEPPFQSRVSPEVTVVSLNCLSSVAPLSIEKKFPAPPRSAFAPGAVQEKLSIKRLAAAAQAAIAAAALAPKFV